MLHYIKGTVFNTPAKTIVNTVNCVGVMGAGLALEFKLRYPEMYNDYKDRCKKDKVLVGRPYIYEQSKDLLILNFPTKNHWRYGSKIEWIEAGLNYFSLNYKKRDLDSVAFPKLGCNNGGLEWEVVKDVMEGYLSDLTIDIYICLNEVNEAEGTERRMVNLINEMDIKRLMKEVNISIKQARIIERNKPVSRFWHIRNYNGIGEKTYERVFKYFYGIANNRLSNKLQMSLNF